MWWKAALIFFIFSIHSAEACVFIKSVYSKKMDGKEWKLKEKPEIHDLATFKAPGVQADLIHPNWEGAIFKTAIFWFDNFKCNIENASADVSLEVNELPSPDENWDLLWKKTMTFQYHEPYTFFYSVLDRNYMVRIEFRNF